MCAPAFCRSVWCVFFLADGCVSLVVMCCDVMWYDVMCLVARLDEVMWLVVRWREVSQCGWLRDVMSCDVIECGVTWCDMMCGVWCIMWSFMWCNAIWCEVMQWDGMLLYVVVMLRGWLWGHVMWCDVVVWWEMMCCEHLWTGMQNAIRLLRAHVTVLRPGTTKY